jgi:flagellar motility protein MotE (MotC chaperone)
MGQRKWLIAAVIALLAGTAQGADPKAAGGDAYDKNLESARASAEEQARLAKIAKEAEDKRLAREAAEKKRLADVAAAEKAERDKEEAKRRIEQDRIVKADERKRMQMERERSCVVKPVMTDAEMANCKKVWR